MAQRHTHAEAGQAFAAIDTVETEARPLWTYLQLAGYKLQNDMPATV
jgi:hypothetical protein